MTDVLDDVLAASIDGICAFDAHHVCTRWSPAMHRLTGVAPDQALGRPRDALLLESTPRTFTLMFSAASDGGVIGVARKSEEGVTELLSLASHKLKTPLTALQIHLGAQLRQLQRGPPDAATLVKSLGQAIEQATRLADTINLLLDVSKIDSGRWKLDLEELELAALMRGVVDRLQHTASGNGCEVRCRVAGETRGRWDRLRLEEVLSNLLANAFKHGAGHPVDVALEDLGASVKLTLSDGGAGMEAEDLARVFERGPRTALGLWITREIVTAHKGTITVTSAPGSGSTFTLTLPKAAA